MTPGSPTSLPERAHGPFVPLLALTLAVTAWLGYQGLALWNERNTLAATRTAQEAPMETARKIRMSLDTLARETALLADKGNANARLIVDELRRRGVTIDPSQPPVK